MPKLDFSVYPMPVQTKLHALRQIIFDVAKKTAGVGKLEEALRWSSPAILRQKREAAAPSGLMESRMSPGNTPCIFTCTSGLIEDFKELYKHEMKFVRNRSIVFDVGDRLPEAALRHCIFLALT